MFALLKGAYELTVLIIINCKGQYRKNKQTKQAKQIILKQYLSNSFVYQTTVLLPKTLMTIYKEGIQY